MALPKHMRVTSCNWFIILWVIHTSVWFDTVIAPSSTFSIVKLGFQTGKRLEANKEIWQPCTGVISGIVANMWLILLIRWLCFSLLCMSHYAWRLVCLRKREKNSKSVLVKSISVIIVKWFPGFKWAAVNSGTTHRVAEHTAAFQSSVTFAHLRVTQIGTKP